MHLEQIPSADSPVVSVHVFCTDLRISQGWKANPSKRLAFPFDPHMYMKTKRKGAEGYLTRTKSNPRYPSQPPGFYCTADRY